MSEPPNTPPSPALNSKLVTGVLAMLAGQFGPQEGVRTMAPGVHELTSPARELTDLGTMMLASYCADLGASMQDQLGDVSAETDFGLVPSTSSADSAETACAGTQDQLGGVPAEARRRK